MRKSESRYEELTLDRLRESRKPDTTSIEKYVLLEEALVYSNLAIAAATEEARLWRDR